MKISKDWYATKAGLELHMNLHIENEVLHVAAVVNDDVLARNYMPAQYVERDMRRRLMDSLEKRIFGDKS